MNIISEPTNTVLKQSVLMEKKYSKNNSSKLWNLLNKLYVRVSIIVYLLGGVLAWGGYDFQKYGPFNIILNSSIIKCNHSRSLNLNVSEIYVYIFDFNNNFNKSFRIDDAAKRILDIKTLNKTKKFVMFVGGFTSHINHEIEKQMREAYKNNLDGYLIIPDHSAYTNDNDGNLKSYSRSVTYVHYIGKALGHMLADLKIAGVSSKNIHCVGHSLGGQILGHTGVAFLNKTGEKISRISALDPAGPCFTSSAVENQVRSGVADYVEVYHSNSGALGSASILGDVDFIMNRKGEVQPNCGTPIVPLIHKSSEAASCNHRICVDLWTAAVKRPSLFTAYKCDTYKNFKKGKCVANPYVLAGPGNSGKAFGEYYLSTEMFNLKSIM